MDMSRTDCSVHYSKGESDYCQTVRIRQLVFAAQSGCASSFAEIRNLYWRRLFATVISITGNPEDAEDVLQDTFLKAFIALKSFQWRSAFYTWLTQIAINSSLMLLRRRRGRRETSFTVMAEDNFQGSQSRDLDFEDPTPSPEEVCSQRQRLLRLNAAIGRLNPRLRAVVETQMKEEYSLRDVARTLNISEAAVKSRLYRARRRLSLARVIGRRPTTGQPQPEGKSSALGVM
jgi:RNA polymerase sigma-70 factor, ECF subfamily